MAKKFRILSIDGGGVRGIVPITILKEIEKRLNGKKIYEVFDLIAGTSTGGIIACGLTASLNGISPKLTIDEVEKIYKEKSKIVFPPKTWFKEKLYKIISLKKPRFSSEGLSKLLREHFEHLKITDCLRPLFIPTYDLESNTAILFKSRHSFLTSLKNAEIYDVCRATSAAPTYFPPYEFTFNKRQMLCIDGGIFMNNPSVGAIAEVSKHHSSPVYNFAPLNFDEIYLLSLGTGHYTNNIARKKVEGWGKLDWAQPIVDIMMQGVNQVTTYEAEEYLKAGNFLRLDINIEDDRYADMADSSDKTISYLINKTKKDIINNTIEMEKLERFFIKAGIIGDV